MGRTTSESTSVKEVFSCKLCFISFWKSFCTEIWSSIIGCTLAVLFMYGIGALYCSISLSFLPMCEISSGTSIWYYMSVGSIVFGVLIWPIGYCVYNILKWWRKRHITTPYPNSILPISRTTPTTYTPPVPAKPKNSFIQTDSECSICTNVMGKSNIKTLQCGHKFHNDCINDWFQRGGGCPYCRKSITTRN